MSFKLELDDMKKGINECYTNPCENQGTCVDLVDGYKCLCMPGQ